MWKTTVFQLLSVVDFNVENNPTFSPQNHFVENCGKLIIKA